MTTFYYTVVTKGQNFTSKVNKFIKYMVRNDNEYIADTDRLYDRRYSGPKYASIYKYEETAQTTYVVCTQYHNIAAELFSASGFEEFKRMYPDSDFIKITPGYKHLGEM